CFPSVTFPCHMSMMHSVCPERHGILTNTYVPMVRPVKGIFEKVNDVKGICTMYYGWEPLRHVYESGAVKLSRYIQAYMEESSDTELTKAAFADIDKFHPDFVFLYMVETDEKGGHDNGWMSDEYLRRISIAIGNAKKVIDTYGDEYSVIITADHGGHDRSHGSDLPEDMTIPLFFFGKEFEKGKELKDVSILDITPTIAKIMGLTPEEDWEGKPVF
ncbi:MAG: alkaline phosphatase family protein, partial [Clostridia bacterium]|nr:alkaline phosphatase family protein [Clostridia bacterium]